MALPLLTKPTESSLSRKGKLIAQAAAINAILDRIEPTFGEINAKLYEGYSEVIEHLTKISNDAAPFRRDDLKTAIEALENSCEKSVREISLASQKLQQRIRAVMDTCDKILIYGSRELIDNNLLADPKLKIKATPQGEAKPYLSLVRPPALDIPVVCEPGSPDKYNEDWATAFRAPNGDIIVIVLDGVTEHRNPDGTLDNGCVHGVVWYVRTLGNAFANLLANPTISLPNALYDGIEYTNEKHGKNPDGSPRCDLSHPHSPSATVAAWRIGEEKSNYLVLCDAKAAYRTKDGRIITITDSKIADAARKSKQMYPTPDAQRPSPQIAKKRQDELVKKRNTEDGYWVASSDPRAAYNGETDEINTEDLIIVEAFSDGATRLQDEFHQLNDEELVKLAERPDKLLTLTRTYERAHASNLHKKHDDLSVVALSPTRE